MSLCVIILLSLVQVFYGDVHGKALSLPPTNIHATRRVLQIPNECPSTYQTAKNQISRIFAPDDPEGNFSLLFFISDICRYSIDEEERTSLPYRLRIHPARRGQVASSD